MGRTNSRPMVGAAVLASALAACGHCDRLCSEGAEHAGKARSSKKSDAPRVTWNDPITVAEGDAHAGPWRMNRSRFYYVDDPTVELTPDGAAGIAWVDNRRQNVLFQKYDAGGQPVLDAPVNVSRSSDIFSWLPKIAMTEDGSKVFVLWQEIVFSGGSHGGEAFFARSTDGGRTFSRPLNLSTSQAGDGKGRLTEEIWHNGSLDVARRSDGTLYATWTAYQGALWLRRSTDGGRHFEDPVRIAGTHEVPARAPSLGVGPDGTVYVAWTVGESDEADIRLARSKDGGQSFGEPRKLFSSGGHSDVPEIAIGERGALHLVYAESPEGMFESYHVRYARMSDSGEVVREPVRIAGPRASGVQSTHFPALELGNDGNVFVVWERYPELEARPRGLGFATSADRGRSFGATSVIPGTLDPELGSNGGLQGLLMDKLAVAAGGAVAVVNSRFDPHEASRIRLIRGRASSR